jgi:DNA-binding IclR family transcriptional regulator
MRHTGESPPSVSERVLDVLDAFSSERPALSLSELSRRTGIPLSSTHRIVAGLVRRGALERDGAGRYRVGLWVWEVASLSSHGMGLRESSMPFLEDLYEATHQNVQLAVLDVPDVVYLERISGRGAVNVVSRAGGRLPAHATGVGLVLLAHAPAEVQEDMLAGPLKRYTDRTISSSSQLRRVLADVRRDGFAISDGQIELPALSVAAPVQGPGDHVVAAISVVVPSTGTDPRTLVPAVRAAARGISRALGAPSATRMSREAFRETSTEWKERGGAEAGNAG